MADVIRIRRRVTPGSPGAPASLQNAELAYNENDHTLYIGEGTGGAGGSATVIVPIAGNSMGSANLPLINGTAAAGSANTFSRNDHVHPTDTTRAPLASPALTGSPTAPTPSPAADSSTKIATTAFVQGAIAAVSSGVTNIAVTNGLSGGGAGAVTIGISANGIVNASLGTMPAHTWKGNNTGATATPIDATSAQLMTDLGAAPINSPSFTGIPTTAATPANGDNTLKLATTAYVLATRLDQFQVPTSDVPWGSKRITGLLDPSNPQDAATKAYADNLAQGIDAKASCVVATTGANITLSGTQTIDGIAVIAGDRVLVKDQTSVPTNGIYVVAAGAWPRALDADTWAELPSAYSFIEKGTVNADNGFLCTVDQGGTLGTTNVTWVQFSGAGQITAGAGLTKTGNTIDAVGTANRITVAADTIDIASTYTGQTSITTLGTIATGTWQGTPIALAYLAGLGTMASQNASAVAITGGTIDGVTLDGGTF